MKQALIRPIEAIVPRAAQGYGGKALHLAALARAGFPVPRAYALRTSAAEAFYASALPPEERPARLFAAPELPDDQVLENIRERLLQAPVPDEVRSELRRALLSLQQGGAHAVAVRSSSTGEDQESASAAGLHLSFLNIQDEETLLEAVRACWAGVLRPRVISYLRTLGANPNAAIGVVVQAMVPAQVAGVLFTVNPVTGDEHEMVLNAAHGLGCGVTDGTVSPDTYRIDKSSGWIRDRVIADKPLQIVAAEGGGVREERVPLSDVRREALDEHTLRQLIEMGRAVEDHFRSPRDIEWAVTGDAIFLLQARPITGADMGRSRTSGRRRLRDRDRMQDVWSNANVGEALPGVATPLTWSVLNRFSERGFRAAFEALGCRVPANAELVGNVRGRIYLNLTEFARVASQAPGVSPDRLFALAGGVRVELEGDHGRGQRGFWLRLPFTVARYARDHVRLGRRLEVHDREFAHEAARIQGIDLRILDAAALDHTLTDIDRLLDQTGALMLTTYGHLLASHLLLQRALELVGVQAADRVLRTLFSVLEDVESALPAQALARIAGIAKSEPQVMRLLSGLLPPRSVAELPPSRTRDALEAFLVEYGYRGVREAELSEPRWVEDPSALLAVLVGHVRGGGLGAIHREKVPRRSVEEVLREVLPRPLRVAPLRRSIAEVVELLRYYLRLREHLRAQVVRVLGLVRAVALDVSRRVLARESDCGADAAFFLTLDEMHSYLRGQRSFVGTAVRRRRLQYRLEQSLPEPPDSFVGYPLALVGNSASVTRLAGLGASSGLGEGPARVLRSASEFAQFSEGEVLVVRHADVGWSPLFLMAAGVVTEVGGPLSHAAVILREYGVPAVFNAVGASTQIRTGDLIRLDGALGVVEVIERASPATEETADGVQR